MTDTKTSKLIINKLTKAQYEAIENPSATELYLTPDTTETDIALAITEHNNSNSSHPTKQDKLIAGTNITIAADGKTISATGGIENTATGSNSLTILGTASTAAFANNIGKLSTATSSGATSLGYSATATGLSSTAIGRSSSASGSYSAALGYNAKVSANNSIQLGNGTNSTANTLQVRSYPLLDTSTGLIPDERLSNNIQRKLTAGSNIDITNNVISATASTYTADPTIDITNSVISALGVKNKNTYDIDRIYDWVGNHNSWYGSDQVSYLTYNTSDIQTCDKTITNLLTYGTYKSFNKAWTDKLFYLHANGYYVTRHCDNINSSFILYSTDLTTWNYESMHGDVIDIIYDDINNKFVILTFHTSYKKYYASYAQNPDSTWNTVQLNIEYVENDTPSICYNNGTILIVGRNTIACTSTDGGVTWTTNTISYSAYRNCVSVINNIYFSQVHFDNYFHFDYSTDSLNWTSIRIALPQEVSFDQKTNIVYFNNTYYFICPNAFQSSAIPYIFKSTDLVNWTYESIQSTVIIDNTNNNYYNNKLITDGNKLILLGQNFTYTSTDGINWTHYLINASANNRNIFYDSIDNCVRILQAPCRNILKEYQYVYYMITTTFENPQNSTVYITNASNELTSNPDYYIYDNNINKMYLASSIARTAFRNSSIQIQIGTRDSIFFYRDSSSTITLSGSTGDAHNYLTFLEDYGILLGNETILCKYKAGNNITIDDATNTISSTSSTYTAGNNIQINGTTISATDTTYTAGDGLLLNNTQFSVNTENNLSSYSAVNPLSANMGRQLNSSITSHINNTNNPHSVTKTQVGLSNVDNTSDINKPVSTATQTALNKKQNTLTAGNNISITQVSPHNLPSGYTELEYIQNLDYSYINLNFTATKDTGIDIDLTYNPILDYVYLGNLFGDTHHTLIVYNSILYYIYGFNETIVATSQTITDNTRYHILYNYNNDKKLIVNNNEVAASMLGDNHLGGSFSIFNCYDSYSVSPLKVYSVKITNGTTLSMELYPAKRNSDNVSGLYDIINDVFYVGTEGSMTAGGEVVSNVISATDTTYTAGNGLTLTGTQFSANITDNVATASTSSSLSANMGKELQDQINNLKARGRFLALWNCATGLAETDPTTSPRPYNSGDYFIVGIIASGSGTNYRPSGTEYVIGQASTTAETLEVNVDDVYYFDGTTWKLQSNTQKTVTFANIGGQPSDNTNLASALNLKANESDLTAHTSNTNNPHSVTKAQVGLGNVDNTSDLNKPISTATQTALDSKENISNKVTSISENSTNAQYPSAKCVYNNVSDKVPFKYVVQDLNPFNSNAKKLWISSIHNAFYRTDERNTVTTNNVSAVNVPRMFNGDFENGANNLITTGNTGVITISTDRSSLFQGPYATGYVYISFYNDRAITSLNQIQIRAYIAGSTQQWRTLTPEVVHTTTISGTNYIEVIRAYQNGSYLQQLEISITNDGTSHSAGIAINEIEYFLIRPNGIKDLPVVTKFTDNEIYGNVTATGFIKKNGTSSQFLKADGSVDSNSYQPSLTAGNNITISGTTISATDTTYTAGNGLTLTGTEFSADTSVLATKSDLTSKEDISNKVTTITSSSTDTQYPSAKAVWDIVGNIEAIVNAIRGV